MSGSELYLGLISGTSADGVDAALVDLTAGQPHALATSTQKMSDEIVADILALNADAPIAPSQLGELDTMLGGVFAKAALDVVSQAGVGLDAVRAIGCHGQTVYHRPDGAYPFTLQMGNPHIIAERTGVTTVADFRRRDMAAGGQGAPFAPLFHQAFLAEPGQVCVCVNLGGIANVTVIHADGSVQGWDTGPANGLLDTWCVEQGQGAFDQAGAWAASGVVNEGLLQRLLGDPYFAKSPPKSTGREYFNLAWLQRHLHGDEVPADVQATLAALTAITLAQALATIEGQTLFLCGGGVHNTDLCTRIQTQCLRFNVQSTAEAGIDPDYMEAIGFAWLAQQRLQQKPLDWRDVTGAEHPALTGVIFPGREYP